MTPFFKPKISKDISLIKKVIQSSFVSEGKIVEKFENKLKEFLKIKYCIAVNSGTSALHLALIASKIKEGDEVILPAQTFIATGLAILYQKATPIFADIDIKTGNIDPADIKKLITKKTKAIIVVHWSGYPCDLSEIKKIIKGKKIKLIEDAAHCFGGRYKDKAIGSVADFTCFSFQATKHLTTSDGGMVSCKSIKNYKFLKKLRWFGFNRKSKPGYLGNRNDNINFLGYKYHLNNYSAALGLSNLKHMKKLINFHAKIGSYYSLRLKNIPGIKLMDFKDDRKHAYWFYQILVIRRSSFIKKVRSLGIPCTVVNSRIDKYNIFKKYRRNLINQNLFEKKKIALPVHEGITKKIIDKLAYELRMGW